MAAYQSIIARSAHTREETIMPVKVAINGFGRIGRLAFRQMFGFGPILSHTSGKRKGPVYHAGKLYVYHAGKLQRGQSARPGRKCKMQRAK